MLCHAAEFMRDGSYLFVKTNLSLVSCEVLFSLNEIKAIFECIAIEQKSLRIIEVKLFDVGPSDSQASQDCEDLLLRTAIIVAGFW